MSKSDSSPVKETPEQELKRLRKENAGLKRHIVRQKDEDKAKPKMWCPNVSKRSKMRADLGTSN